MSLRRLFVKTFIVDFDTTLYTTRPEREWAYIAKRYSIRLFKRVQVRRDAEIDRHGLVDCQCPLELFDLEGQEDRLVAPGGGCPCLPLFPAIVTIH